MGDHRAAQLIAAPPLSAPLSSPGMFAPANGAILLPLLLLLLLCQWTVQERTRKASRGTVERIRRLITEKATRQLAQNDAVKVPELPARNPAAKRHHDELAVNGPDGQYLQGDLELAEWQAERLAKEFGGEEGGGRRRRRKVGREPFYKRWDKQRPVSFDIAENVPEETRQKIRQALALWQRETCLRFVEGGPDVDRLEFFDGAGCSSFVGRAGGTQGISIATPGCDFVGIIAHEIGHALGTFHEQARPDQPRHISVHYSNIPVSRWNNFQPVSEDQAETLGLPYDAGSVMHYGPYGFASDQFRPTISTLDRHWQSTIGQRAGPSFLDIQAVNQAYACSEHCSPSLGGECQHGGYAHPNDCSRCQCPTGFSGQFCQSVQPSPCGDSLQLSTRQSLISSPNHPGPFPPDLDCFWLLKAPPGGHVFLQFMDQFDYTCEDTCDKAFVEVKTGPDFRVTGYRFCCSIAPGNSFRSVANEMLVIHSGTGPTSGGFKARVWSDLDPEEVEPNWIDSEQFAGEMASKSASTRGRQTTQTTVASQLPSSEWPSSSTSPSTSQMASSTSTTVLTSPTTSPSSSPHPPLFPSPPPLNCSCLDWSAWGQCSQMCGGCGRRRRQRQCATGQPLCQLEERRMCNQGTCPAGTNFLFNNGEFHLLWKGCCIGLFPRNGPESNSTSGQSPGECGPLDTSDNAFLRIISSLLSSQDGKRRGNGTEEEMLLVKRRRTGEH